jgi:hypothetical protein
MAVSMAPATRVTVRSHWATSVRRAVSVRRLARNGTSRSAATTIVEAAAMVTG